MPRRLARTFALSSVLAVLLLVAATSSAGAYGNNTQWQVGFSGTCSSQSSCPFGPAPATGASGFWGWCAFGGSLPDGMSGTFADCKLTTYSGPASSLNITYDVTHWFINTGSVFLPPGVLGFFVTPGAGTLEITGPGPVPPFVPKGVPFPIPDPCPTFICDLGIPALAGHFSFHPSPGVALEIQVTKVP